MSRMARNNKDWHHLMEMCAIFGTILADEDRIYDPRDAEDRLLLGFKGTISEYELVLMHNRLERGRLHKAKAGPLILDVPCGYVKLPTGEVARDPDEQVQATVQLVFDKFDELGSCRRLYRHLVRSGIPPGDARPPRTATWSVGMAAPANSGHESGSGTGPLLAIWASREVAGGAEGAGQVRYWQYGQAEKSPDLSDPSRFLVQPRSPRLEDAEIAFAPCLPEFERSFGFSAFDTGRITPQEKTIVMTLLFIASCPSCRNREGTHSQSLVEKVTMGKSGCRCVLETRRTIGCLRGNRFRCRVRGGFQARLDRAA